MVCLEIARPESRLFATFYGLWFDRIVPRLGAAVSGDPGAYSYLPASVREFVAPDVLAGIMERNGLQDVTWRRLAGGIITLHRGIRGFVGEEDSLRSALPERVFGLLDEVEARLREVGRSAPGGLDRPALEALTSGGKRLRPLLLLLSAGIGAPDRDAVLRAATATEVLHTATLIHDDIVDKAKSRRGYPPPWPAMGGRLRWRPGTTFSPRRSQPSRPSGTRG